MPYHVAITPKSDKSHEEIRLDLSESELRERFLDPYREGRPIIIGGKTITPDDIERITIHFTEETSEQLLPRVRAEQAASGVISAISDDWYVAHRGEDVTDRMITTPPGTGLRDRPTREGPRVEGSRVVFVVHGRNRAARDAMFSFLRSLSLEPLEWNEAVGATGRTMPYVGDVLTAAFSTAQAVLVLMTPDDLAHLREQFQQPGDAQHETQPTGQARPNVLFEAGMAMGRDEDRTILVELGTLRPFSDIGGRHVIRLNNGTERRQELAQRLEAAGCPVRLTGVDWHTAGDFDAAIRSSITNIERK
jgi:predicted nucleotide-binding protein